MERRKKPRKRWKRKLRNKSRQERVNECLEKFYKQSEALLEIEKEMKERKSLSSENKVKAKKSKSRMLISLSEDRIPQH